MRLDQKSEKESIFSLIRKESFECGKRGKASHHTRLRFLYFCIFFLLSSTAISKAKGKNSKSISFYEKNRYYFQDSKGKPFISIGDYTWETFSGADFDFDRMFDSLKSRGLNLARIWLWWGCENIPSSSGFLYDTKVHIEPYLRDGAVSANDGRPKYNLDKFNPAFFSRLVQLCKSADKRGINLQLIMMDAWMIKHQRLWRLHAFNRVNNINDVDGDPRNTGLGTDKKQGFCSMGNPKVLEYQKAYIAKIVETVNRFDNIYFEIANENFYSEDWELTLGDFIKNVELKMPNKHLIIRRDFPSHHYVVQKWNPLTIHEAILNKRDLKVTLLFDTDWEINKSDSQIRKAAWSAIASGGHFSYMDDAMEFRRDTVIKDHRAQLHKQIDYIAKFMKNLKPWEMEPDNVLIKSGLSFALANNKKLFAYLPEGGEITIDLSAMKKRRVSGKWYDPLKGKFGLAFSIEAKAETVMSAPNKNDWVLIIKTK